MHAQIMHDILSGAAYGSLHASWWVEVLWTLVSTHLTIVGVTVYLHRCQAHRAIELHPVVSHAMRAWLWLTTGMVTGEWVAIHRKHHARCDRDEDPHSPQTKGLATVWWRGAELYREESRKAETLTRFGHGVPDDSIEQHLYRRHPTLGIVLMLAIDVLMFGASGLAVWAVQMAWIPFWAAGIVNGLGHAWGYRNFDSDDASRNLVPWGLLIGGEELHNNHHAYATSAKLSRQWFEIDLGWGYIQTLAWLRLARVRETPASLRQNPEVDRLDLNTLHTVLGHRYEIMKNYARSFKRACKEEQGHRWEIGGRRCGVLGAATWRQAQRWLHRHESRWSAQQHQEWCRLREHSPAARWGVELRQDLSRLWSRSSASKEQLLEQLKAWCDRAEQSQVAALQHFARQIRSYV